MNTLRIPPRPEPTLQLWVLPPPCGTCDSCQERARIEYQVTFMNAHFGRAVEDLDPRLPNYLRAVDQLVAERDREVARIRANMPYCDQSVTIDVEAL